MEKYYKEFDGKQYVVREVNLSLILDNYMVETIGSDEYAKALQDAEKNGCDVSDYDNEIYCYLDSGFIESDPTDAEILLAIIRQEGEEQTDQQWYNLMRLADSEISQMYESGKININCEGYECGGDYSVYAYNGKCQHSLYYGKSAKVAAITLVNVVTTIRLMLQR